MKIEHLLDAARDAMTAGRVYGTPVERDGMVVIPAAKVLGGGGGGNGRDSAGQAGDGGGMGLVARPVGAYVIKDGTLRWVPAVDVTRVIGTVGAVVVAALLAGARLGRR